MLQLSVLDQSPVRSGGTPADAIAETVRLAQAAERLGYRRYWLAEHHGSADFAGSAPEILITRVAAATSAIRVGSGGVMLSHYSPYKVAETFRLLETMYPGRIDLGIGRAPGADHITSVALAYGSPIGVEYFPTKIADLTAFLTGGKPATEALAPVHVNPQVDTVPEIWLLGSSDESARYAAHFGLAFSFAQFISPLGGEAVLDAYRKNFRPSPLLAAPRASVGVFVICAETEAEARRLGRSRDLWRLRIDRGERQPYPSVEEAEAYPYTPEELAHIERNRRRSFFGTPDQVKAHLTELAQRYGVDELVILTICHDPAARLRSYELLAQAFGLTPRG
jgi:luciferase family oxidoreductase group 1